MKQKLKGSILAYSLIVLAMMMAIATSLSIATIIEKKGASGTEFSMQSLQTADSGVQLALKKINGNLTKNVINIYGGCAAGVVKNLGDAGQGTYDLYFYADDGVTPADCAQPANKIANIKAVGTYKNTVRSVNVAVAASGFVINDPVSASGAGFATAVCATGTKIVGGGGACTGAMFASYPTITPNGWIIKCVDVYDTASAYAICGK